MTKVDDLFFGVMSFLVAVSSADILWWLVEVPLESVQDPHVCHLQVVIINDPSYKHQQLGGGVSTPSTSLGSLANMLMVTGKVLRLILVVDHSSHFWKLIVLGQWKWLGFPSYPRNTHYIRCIWGWLWMVASQRYHHFPSEEIVAMMDSQCQWCMKWSTQNHCRSSNNVEGFAHEVCDGKCVDEEPCFIASHGHFESQLKVWGVKIFVESFVMA